MEIKGFYTCSCFAYLVIIDLPITNYPLYTLGFKLLVVSKIVSISSYVVIFKIVSFGDGNLGFHIANKKHKIVQRTMEGFILP